MMGGMQQDPNMMQQQPMDPMMDQQAPMAPADDFIEPDMQLKFGGPSRDKAFLGRKNRGNRGARKAARQERRAARKEMRQDRRAARQEIRQLPREERRAARQEMRQDFKARRQGIRDDFQAAKAMGPGAGAMPPQKSMSAASSRTPGTPPAGAAKPGAPMDPARVKSPSELQAGPMNQKMAQGPTAFKKGGKKPREKALFGRIANAIRKGKAAKDAGGGLMDIAKGAATGAMTGNLGLAATGIKALRSPKEKREERKAARKERRAARKEMTRAERRADRKSARQERRAARKERRAKRKEFRTEMREDRRDVRANAGGDTPSKPKPSSSASDRPMAPPMTAMVEKGGRKNMVDRRVKKKSGGYGIEKSASGKKMADTLGVTKNRKKAVQGTRKLNKLASKKKKLERKIKESAGAVNAEGAARMKAGKEGNGKLKKQLERRRGRLDKLDSKMKRVRARKKTA